MPEIIAEVGVNHNGNIDYAKKLIINAKIAGADYVKFQTFLANNLVRRNQKLMSYQKKNIKKKITQYKMLKKLELSKNDHLRLINFCKKKKIKFLSSPFDVESCKLLINLGIKNLKIPSGEINNYPLLIYIAKNAKKVFLSTGMSIIHEISKSLKILTNNGLKKRQITLLHCNTDYPTRLEDVNLLAMKTMRDKFKINVGYSDHTNSNETAIAAVALGAKVIEKHITLSKSLTGPDHKSSFTKKEFINYVKYVKNCSILLGSKKKTPSKSEKKNMNSVRKSIVAKKNIKRGEIFTEENLICKRPSQGISPYEWPKLIGSKSNKNYRKDDFIKK
mgnify:CR=1 FL=1|jgi:N,N'-diacetyllegionaminate synthase